MNPIEILTEHFMKFPGIGKRQAERFVYFLLRADQNTREQMAAAITDLTKTVHTCERCQRFFTTEKDKLCSVCSEPSRDKQLLLVVAHDADLQNIHQNGNYTGYYFVLGGTVPVLDKEPNARVRIKELKAYIKEYKPSEIILALSTNPEGENTRTYITKELQTLQKENKFKISTLGRGLSTGAELEYSDPETIQNALENRQ